jgi:hypothetical protein
MESRSLARLSPACVLSLAVAVMVLLSSLTVNAQRPPSAPLTRKDIDTRARQVFRNEIIKGQGREADDTDLDKWLSTFKDGAVLTIASIETLRAKLGNGFGAPETTSAGVAYVLPAVPPMVLREFRIAADADSDWNLEDWITIEKYQMRLQGRMDDDSSGKISEDEFANYATKFYDYIPVLMRR